MTRLDPLELFGQAPSGAVTSTEVMDNRRLCTSIVGMFAAGMDTDQIGNRLVIRKHIVAQVLRIEREKQRAVLGADIFGTTA